MKQDLISRLYVYFDSKGSSRTQVENELFLEVKKSMPQDIVGVDTSNIYYQPELYIDDGTNVSYLLPDGLNSFDVFETREYCEEWLDNNGYDLRDCIIHEYQDDDIEERVYLDGNGNILSIQEFEEEDY